MCILKADFKNWHIQYDPDDGARIVSLNYAGHNLFTLNADNFRNPDRFYGEYETRPVYGYDDCFPTVDPCTYPLGIFECRDHGELCWQEWNTEIRGNSLICQTECLKPAVSFKRTLSFDGNRLSWLFEVTSLADERSVFLHVMHALLPLDGIAGLVLPECKTIFDEIKIEETGLRGSDDAGEHLMAFQPGSFCMLLLREITEGFVKLRFKDGLALEIRFDKKLFPTLGIWWNNGGYPEGGAVRTECAFEPLPGTCSDLAKSFNDGVYLSVEPGKQMVWEISWTVSNFGEGVL
jgi:hypothetical protein